MSKPLDILGKKFGRLIVIKRVENNSYGKSRWLCNCDCGVELCVVGSNLVNGLTKSCGCAKIENVKKLKTIHNKSQTKIHCVWSHIKQRCCNENSKAYKNYGGRGITVCDEWKNDFISFYNWAINNGYKEGLSIDRIDNNGNYEPSNCRWVTRTVQNRNTRRTHFIEYNGKIYVMKDLAKALNINYNTFANRILTYGWSVQEAIDGKRINKVTYEKYKL